MENRSKIFFLILLSAVILWGSFFVGDLLSIGGKVDNWYDVPYVLTAFVLYTYVLSRALMIYLV